ncbi:MAG: PepSY domain-containing protein [Deinococcota bacterium]
MNKNTRHLLFALAITAAGVPLAGYAFAQTAPAQSHNTQDNDTETQDDHTPAYKGSIQLPAEQRGMELPDTQEEAQLRGLARITPQQASQAAQAVVPGTVRSVKLENENGTLVYAVVIGQTEVKVDAGNGRVLHQERAGQDKQRGEQEGGQNSETNDGQ